MIFDEIHEAISNFSKIGIIQLFLWKDVVDKIVVLSATFNLASVSVIKYFSLLTSGKIKILDSAREIKREQSRLYLHYDNSDYFNNKSTLRRIVSSAIAENRFLDILAYSKRLSQEIVKRNEPIGDMLFEQYGEVRVCVSELIEDIDPYSLEQSNRYNNNFCNVGTNFKSGVSINKDNHTLIIILPPAVARRTYKSVNGVFSEGINSVIQALARQRRVGEIHIILPYPLALDYDTLEGMSENQLQVFQQKYDDISASISSQRNRNNVATPRNRIIPFSEHKTIIDLSYEKLARRLFLPIIKASIFNIEFPDKVEYVLNNAELVLTQEGFLGKDLSCFVTYSAFTNQFYNARLAGISYFPSFRVEDFDPQLEAFYDEYIAEEENRGKRISRKFEDFRDRFLSIANTNFSSNIRRTLKEKVFSFLISKIGSSQLKSDSFRYLVEEYQCFEVLPNDASRESINKLNEFIERFKASFLEVGSEKFIKNYNQNSIFENDKQEILRIISMIKEIHPALSLPKARFFVNIDDNNAGEMMYKYLHENLVETSRSRKRIGGVLMDLKKVIRVIDCQNL